MAEAKQSVPVMELEGEALDWAVALAEGLVDPISQQVEADSWEPSTNWCHAGPIIERENIEWASVDSQRKERLVLVTKWAAWSGMDAFLRPNPVDFPNVEDLPAAFGPTQLVAAMRAYLKNRLGAFVSVPVRLLEKSHG